VVQAVLSAQGRRPRVPRPRSYWPRTRPIVRAGFARCWTRAADESRLSAEAATGTEATSTGLGASPDVVVMDIQDAGAGWPGGDPPADQIRTRPLSQDRVLVLTTFEIDEYGLRGARRRRQRLS